MSIRHDYDTHGAVGIWDSDISPKPDGDTLVGAVVMQSGIIKYGLYLRKIVQGTADNLPRQRDRSLSGSEPAEFLDGQLVEGHHLIMVKRPTSIKLDDYITLHETDGTHTQSVIDALKKKATELAALHAPTPSGTRPNRTVPVRHMPDKHAR